MFIQLSKFQSEEIEHKLWIVHDETELLEAYKFQEFQIENIISALPSNGGQWFVPDWAVGMVKEEMRDYPYILRKFEPAKPVVKRVLPENFSASHIDFQYCDGGRDASGRKGETGDCVVRAISIATGLSYDKVYKDLFAETKVYKNKKKDKVARHLNGKGCKTTSPRNGVYRKIYEPYLLALGWKWVAVSGIGSGCKMHLHKSELPAEKTIIVRLSKHLACVKSGILYDTYDCSRNGTRQVYGYYIKE